jgi:hypothetical protein
MIKTALLGAMASTLLGSLAFAAPPDPKQQYFDYEEFVAVRALDPNMQEARLCGMNKACMRLWKNGDLLATEHGMVVRADFNDDGERDIGIAMEKDKAAPAEGIEYFVMAATRNKDGSFRLLQTVPLPGTHAVIDTFWEEPKHSIAVDTGERQLMSESTVTMAGDGKLIGGFSKKTGNVETRLTYLNWDAKNKKFDTSRSYVKL